MRGLDADWRLYLLPSFGEGVVRVTVERTPLPIAVVQGLHR
jgi:hypothetical protein